MNPLPRFVQQSHPATFTDTRRLKYGVSPPLFLTGISVLTPKVRLPEVPCGDLRLNKDSALVGVVGGTTGINEGIEALVRSGAVANLNEDLNSYLSGRSVCEGKMEPERLVKSFRTHREAARAYCNQTGTGPRVYYYLGDLELIIANAKEVSGCRPELPTVTYTDDRYAIFSQTDWKKDPERAQRVARFQEILARKIVASPSLLKTVFDASFQGQRPSRKLQLFFWSIAGFTE